MFEIQGTCGDTRIVRNLFPDGLRWVHDAFAVNADDTAKSMISVIPAKVRGMVIDSPQPVTVNIGNATFRVGPCPLVWNDSIANGTGFPCSVDAIPEVVNEGEDRTVVRISVGY